MGSGSVDSGCHELSENYGLYSVEHHKVEKWSYKVGCGWVLWVWWVSVGDGSVGRGLLGGGCHQLSENIWFDRLTVVLR